MKVDDCTLAQNWNRLEASCYYNGEEGEVVYLVLCIGFNRFKMFLLRLILRLFKAGYNLQIVGKDGRMGK